MITEAKAAARRKAAFIMLVEQDLMLARFLAGLHSHKVHAAPLPSLPCSNSHSLTHSFTHSLIQSLTQSLLHSLTHPLINSLFHSRTHTHLLTHSLAHSPKHRHSVQAHPMSTCDDCHGSCIKTTVIGCKM